MKKLLNSFYKMFFKKKSALEHIDLNSFLKEEKKKLPRINMYDREGVLRAEFLSRQEICDYLCLSKSTVQRLLSGKSKHKDGYLFEVLK